MSDIPELEFSLDVRSLKTWLEEEDGRPVLHLADDWQHITVEWVDDDNEDDAITGARTFAETVRLFAAAVDMAGSWGPLPGFVPDREGHSVSGF